MGYYIDLNTITLEGFMLKLKDAPLLPSRMLLKEQLEDRFNYFRNAGIRNLGELQSALKKKNLFGEMLKDQLFTEEYLSVLLREINSIQPKPSLLKGFPGIPDETASKLAKTGIKDTYSLYNRVLTPGQRKQLAEESGVSEQAILELTRLSDLSRIRWVGAMFARVLYETGYDTAKKVSEADYQELHKLITQLNKERSLYKGNIGANDIRLSVEAAKDLAFEIEY